MNTSVKGCLNAIKRGNHSSFTHRGKIMTKIEVLTVLEYAQKIGYKTTDDIPDNEIDEILDKLRSK
jgi:hypothetical protein